eukprot:1175733-Prymnesium_polylepis.1
MSCPARVARHPGSSRARVSAPSGQDARRSARCRGKSCRSDPTPSVMPSSHVRSPARSSCAPAAPLTPTATSGCTTRSPSARRRYARGQWRSSLGSRRRSPAKAALSCSAPRRRSPTPPLSAS